MLSDLAMGPSLSSLFLPPVPLRLVWDAPSPNHQPSPPEVSGAFFPSETNGNMCLPVTLPPELPDGGAGGTRGAPPTTETPRYKEFLRLD